MRSQAPPSGDEPPAPTLDKQDFETLSEFRCRLRRFLRVSEDLAHAQGITPLQYLLMLHIKGYPGREWATVGELAERLQAAPHGMVALITRCEEAGLVVRLAVQHQDELSAFGRAFKIPDAK